MGRINHPQMVGSLLGFSPDQKQYLQLSNHVFFWFYLKMGDSLNITPLVIDLTPSFYSMVPYMCIYIPYVFYLSFLGVFNMNRGQDYYM